MPSSTEHDLQRATPESQGVASSAVLQFVAAIEEQIHEIHSFMLLRHGSVIAEGGGRLMGQNIRICFFR